MSGNTYFILSQNRGTAHTDPHYKKQLYKGVPQSGNPNFPCSVSGTPNPKTLFDPNPG